MIDKTDINERTKNKERKFYNNSGDRYSHVEENTGVGGKDTATEA